MNKTIKYITGEQKRITEIVTNKFKEYYLTGGTALSFHFNHRFSEDLDFFTQRYKKADPDKIMNYIAEKTGFSFKLEAEQNDPKLIPMKVYYMELKKGSILKIDFVQDFEKNIQKIAKGLHSIEDIYFRKINITTGTGRKESITGKLMAVGRQTVKDLFDIYYLSKHYKPVSDFFLDYFARDRAENIITWYKGFNRMDLKLELMDLVPGIDTGNVLKHLDDEILKILPDKLIR